MMRAREDWLKRTGAMWGGGSSAARVHAEPVTQWERIAEPAVPDGKDVAAAKPEEPEGKDGGCEALDIGLGAVKTEEDVPLWRRPVRHVG